MLYTKYKTGLYCLFSFQFCFAVVATHVTCDPFSPFAKHSSGFECECGWKKGSHGSESIAIGTTLRRTLSSTV